MASEEIYDRRSDGKLTCLAAVALDHEGRLIPKTHTIPDFVKNLYTIQNFDKNKNWIENSSISTEFFSASFDDFINPQHPQKIFSYEDFYTYLKKVITLLNCIDEREIKFITTINIKKIISPIKSNKIEINIPDEEFLDDIEKNEEILNKKIRSLKIFPSLYTKDLSKIITSIKTKPCGKSLKEYLNDGENIEKKDIYNNHTELQNVIAPHYIPSAKWPRNDTLSLAQQASLNIALREKEGLFSINGPPGTGKTTLLRDVISEIIVKRAEVLIQFNSPKNAFERSIKTNDGFILKSHQINPKLCGFEIIVATSNNNAAENVSKELPSLNEIDLNSFNDHPENNYFSHVAEYYSTNEKLWGCISAALGNQENLRNFLNTFWNKHHPSSMRYLLERWNFHDEEFNQVVKSGLYTYSDKYLWIRQKFYEIDVEYKKKWKEEKKNFEALKKSFDSLIIKYSEAESAMKKIKNINLDLANECSEIKNIEKKISVCNSRITYLDRNDYLIIGLYLHLLEELTLQYRQKKYNELISLIYKTQQDLQQKVNEHRHLEKHIDDIQITKENYLAIKPNWITRIIYRTKTKNWYNKFDHLIEEDSKNRKKLRTLENSIENLKYSLSLLLKNKEYLEEKFEQQNDPGINDENLLTLSSKAKKLLKLIIVIIKYKQIMYNLVNQLTLKKEALSNNVIHLTKNRKLLHNKITAAQRDFSSDPENFPSEKYWMKSNNELHLSSPWSNQKINKIRIQLFWSAMRLHKYFIILAREPIQSNITALTYLLRNNLPENHSINYLSLWQTLFLIVPVISSAFGSMQNLFRHVHQEEIGWLLIDEAGQTIPHHAVGAIWRSKRVIVVGDPFQLEPIVNLPTILSYKLCEFHNVSFLYDLSKQSAQTLSDLSNPFGTSRNNQDDDIWVGAPLIVHRRCLSPIFEVANEIAYHHTMIQATQPSISVLDGIFTKSVWISPNSIPATNLESHWIEHEGKIACYMFDKIINRLLILPPIFIITPFASVEEELNNYIMQKYLYSWAEKLKCNPETLKKHLEEKIGTIHTFQGKQADTVILLLGGNKQGAIEWAARTPNMLNVAITRSKKVVCVIGNFHLWGQQPYFSVLAKNIPIVTDGKTLQQQFFFACKNQDHKSNELIT